MLSGIRQTFHTLTVGSEGLSALWTHTHSQTHRELRLQFLTTSAVCQE